MKKLLDGKCGIITGGNSGIGEAAADPRVMFKVLAYAAEELHLYSNQ